MTLDGYDRETAFLYWTIFWAWLLLVLAGAALVFVNLVGWVDDSWWGVAIVCASLWGVATVLALVPGRGLSGEMSRRG